MAYHGDFALETTFDFKFTTVDNTGLPVTLASGEVEIYEDNSTSAITGAETLTLDFNSLTGLHNVRVAATAVNGFGVGQEYTVVVSVGTIDSISAVGYVVGSFSIENRAALMPTTNGTRLDVTATGAAGIDWANVESQGTTVDLSATDINLVDTTTTNTDMVGTNSALLAASAPTNFGDLSITASTGLVDITQTAADKAWSTSTRVLTAGTNLNDISTAEVNSEVSDVLKTDTISELGVAAPAATPTFENALMLVYMALRNKLDTTSTLLEVHNDAGTIIAQATLSDDGTTFTRAEMVSG